MAKQTATTFIGQIEFSDTGHAGVRLNVLTTTQRDALVATNGMVIYNSTTGTLQGYENGAWKDLVLDATKVPLSGGTMTGARNINTASGTDNLRIASGGAAADTNLIQVMGGRSEFGYDGSLGDAIVRGGSSEGASIYVNSRTRTLQVGSNGNVGIGKAAATALGVNGTATTTGPGRQLERNATADRKDSCQRGRHWHAGSDRVGS